MNKSGDSSNSDSEKSMKNKPKSRGKKRKRFPSDSSENEGILPDNTLEMEKKVHDSAVKNNLDDTSVRKILKSVVTNDHVLALVKLQEEAEDSGPEENSLRPKLTRAKVKELKKVSPRTPAWNLDNLELTPIKHIPVKTRPEVKALIAQELPDDEDDEEYQPTNDDVPSDDDQGLESCSDVDSQPRTPATPRSQHSISPRVVKDGPFKVPQDVSTPTRRKLDLEEDATIALRTRSKLSLSATSIEHIESNFVPPDEVPPAVDDIWNEFLTECLNPASVTRTEEDDETDPEYNVAADPDANDEDEEALGNSLIKISKKELNDLMTELLSIMPATADDELMTNNLANSVLTDNSHTEGNSTRWDGKVEPLSDEEKRPSLSDRITFENKGYSQLLSVGKREPEEAVQDSMTNVRVNVQDSERNLRNPKGVGINLKVDVRESVDIVRDSKESGPEANVRRSDKNVRAMDNSKDSLVKKSRGKTQKTKRTGPTQVSMEIEEIVESAPSGVESAPPLLQKHLRPASRDCVLINVEPNACVLPEQLEILQQQLRQHIQLASSNYLQLYVHPTHWSHAPPYKEYLESLLKLGEDNPESVVNVCNLRPAVKLIHDWEKNVSEATPENTAMIKFMQQQTERSKRGGIHKHYHGGAFHDKLMRTVAESTVFLYPQLLPGMPYRADQTRRFSYLRSEDELIALGLDQFWQYVENNPQLYKPRPSSHPRHRWGVTVTVQLVCKYMFPWLIPKILLGHMQHMKKVGDKDNPIVKFFNSREVTPVEHRLLPFDPQMTLYDHSEHEMPKIWVRFLGQSSQRFRQHIYRRSITLKKQEPIGVPINITQSIQQPPKNPLHNDFTKEIACNRQNAIKQDQPPQYMYKLVETSTGAFLMPITTMNVDSNTTPIATAQIITSESSKDTTPKRTTVSDIHCSCCLLLKKICKRQTVMEEYFGKNPRKLCDCKRKCYPKITNRLKLLVSQFRSNYVYSLEVIKGKLEILKDRRLKKCDDDVFSSIDNNLDDLVAVTQFHSRLLTKMLVVRDTSIKKKVHTALSRFKLGNEDPVELAQKLFEACGAELVDIYKEFLGFLTPVQAERAGVFKDHFLSNMMDLVEKVEAQVKELQAKRKILECLKGVYTTNLATSCEICTNLLSSLHKYPDLARHVFSLFPHTKKSNTTKPASNSQPQLTIVLTQHTETTQVPGNQNVQGDTNLPAKPITVPSESNVRANVPNEIETSDGKQNDSTLNDTYATMDYEADHSTNNVEDSDNSDSTEKGDGYAQSVDIKMEHPSAENGEPEQNHFNPEITVSKTEILDYDHSSNHSLVVVFEDEDDVIKPEAPEWRRDEDKVILQLLKEHLTPEQRQDKTISDVIEEKALIDLASQSLTEKSIEDIRRRIMYLLQLLVLSEV